MERCSGSQENRERARCERFNSRRLVHGLSTFIVLVAVLGVLRSANAYAQPNGLVGLQISCTNRVAQVPTNLPISVCITNASTNIVAVAVPVCLLSDYEVWLTHGSANPTNIVPKPRSTGPGAFRGTGFWQIAPSKSVACTLDIPLGTSIGRGKHTLVVKRWCVIFLDTRPDGKVTSSKSKLLSSNPIEFQVE